MWFNPAALDLKFTVLSILFLTLTQTSFWCCWPAFLTLIMREFTILCWMTRAVKSALLSPVGSLHRWPAYFYCNFQCSPSWGWLSKLIFLPSFYWHACYGCHIPYGCFEKEFPLSRLFLKYSCVKTFHTFIAITFLEFPTLYVHLIFPSISDSVYQYLVDVFLWHIPSIVWSCKVWNIVVEIG